MLVREVMTSPAVTVRTDTPVKQALALLDEHSVTTLPVLSPAGVIVGVLGEADLIREVVQPDGRTRMIPEQAGPRTLPPHTAVDVMNHRPVTVRGADDLAQAVELMTAIAVKSLPVIDEHHHVVGVLSRSDVVRVLARRDETLEKDVDALLADIGVDWLAEVEDGVVTVTGPVGPRERALAETVAATVPGVVAVIVSETQGARVKPAP